MLLSVDAVQAHAQGSASQSSAKTEMENLWLAMILLYILGQYMMKADRAIWPLIGI